MKVKKLHKDAVIPKYAKQGDSGFDLAAVEDTIIEAGETKLIKTGLAFDIPEGYEIQIRPRSGITLKTDLRVQFGTVDAGYKGEVGVIVDNIRNLKPDEFGFMEMDGLIGGKNGVYIVQKGYRIAQAILAPVAHTTLVEADELSESERGVNGYGSTGVN